MDPRTWSYVLENGITVTLIPRNDTKDLVYFSLVMRNGKIDETVDQLSYTHLFEHLFAQFTSTKHPSSKEIKNRLSYIGALTNAYTDIYTTGYWILGNNKHLKYYIDLFSSAYFDFQFDGNGNDAKEWNKHKNVVIEEIKMRNNDTWESVYETIDKKMYGSRHRLGVDWKSELNNVKIAELEPLIRYNLSKFNPSCTTLFVEGNFNLLHTKKWLKLFFDKKGNQDHINTKYVLKIPKILKMSSFTQSTNNNVVVVRTQNSTKNSIVVFTWTIWSSTINAFNQETSATLWVLNHYFCSGYLSRLFEVLREDKGLIYNLSSLYDLSPDPTIIPSTFQIEIQVDPINVKKVIKMVQQEIEFLKKNEISLHDMTRIKNKIRFKKSIINTSKPPGKFTDTYAFNVVWKKPVPTFSNYFKILNQTTSKDICEMAKQVFQPKNLLIVVGDGRYKT